MLFKLTYSYCLLIYSFTSEVYCVLQYGSIDMRNKTAEEAYLEMLKPGENIKIKTQYRIEEFNKIKDLPGDGFYIRYSSVTGNDSIRLLG